MTTAPLSFAQERLWVLHEIDDGVDPYSIVTVVRLNGPLDSARFDSGNYYFLINYDGISVLHANKKIQSTDMKPLKDADGKFFVQEMVSLA